MRKRQIEEAARIALVDAFGHHEERIADALEGIHEALVEFVHLVRERFTPRAVSSVITVRGDPMQATQNFTDANGLVAAAPAGLVEAWASDNDAVATVDAASGAVTEVGEGTANISVANSGAFLPDGVTPFPDPAPFALTVTVGAAVASTISVS